MAFRGDRLALLLPVGVAVAVAIMHPPAWSPYDDAMVLQEAEMFGPAVLARSYAGSLIVVQRVASLLEGPNPLMIGALFSYAAVALVGLFLAARVHPAAPLVLLLAPFTAGIYGSLSNIQWILAVFLVAMLVARPPVGRERLTDGIGIAMAGLTGPFSVLLLPLYAIRAKNPVWRWHFLVLALVATCQVIAIVATLAGSRQGLPPHDVPAVMLHRGLLPVGLILLAGNRLPWPCTAGALYVALVIPFLGVNATYHTTDELLNTWAGQRYFYLPWIAAIGMVGLAVTREPGAWLPAERRHDHDAVTAGAAALRARLAPATTATAARPASGAARTRR